MSERVGVVIAIVSSCLGGTAAAVTRYLVTDADPITLAILRWGIGFVCVLPVALLLKAKWPTRRDLSSWKAAYLMVFGPGLKPSRLYCPQPQTIRACAVLRTA